MRDDEFAVCPEVLGWRLEKLSEIDGTSDADGILETWRCDGSSMRFRLTYSGELKSGAKKSRPEDKWTIRNSFAPKLQELWGIHPTLLGNAFAYETPEELVSEAEGDRDRWAILSQERNRKVLSEPVEVCGLQFIPLVRRSLHLTCSLDILFLRKDNPGSVLVGSAGDLDNRMKVLFDGLSVPRPEQIGVGEGTFAQPLHCLLEDDRLVTDVAVRTDRLLSGPNAPPAQVMLIIDVMVRAGRWTVQNLPFVGGLR